MMKRIKLHLFTVLTMALWALSATAVDFEVDGIYYNIINDTEAAVTYVIDGEDVIVSDYTGDIIIPETVTYNGTTYSVTTIGETAFYYCRGLTSINIPNSVTSIGNYAFQNCSGLISVNIPNSVTSIGNGAFGNCSSMTNVDIPNSVTTIGEWAFSDCSGLTSVTIGNSVTSIERGVFSNCRELASVTIPNSVTSIGDRAFNGCSGLISVNIPISVTSIGDRAFYGCSGLISANIPISVTSIGEGAFGYCSSITNVDIPNSVTTISGGAFQYCSGLTSVTFPNSVTSIGEYAFYGCNLTSLKLHQSITSIGKQAFNNNSSIETVTCAATTPPSWGDIALFTTNVYNHTPLYVPIGSERTYMADQCWGQFVTIIGINIYDDISIEDFEVDGVWYRALTDSTAMVISMPDEEDYYSGDMVIPETVIHESYTFAVTAIDEGAFDGCYDLNSVVLGDAVETIGEAAFQGCTGLTSVTIGSGVTSIGAKAFNYCNALQTVTCRGTVPPVMASSNCFTNAAYSRAILKVPRPEIETYSATDYWYKFSHIEGWGYLGPGDVNGSGTVDMDDLTRMINILLSDDLDGIDPAWADVTGNGIVSMNDLTELINILLTQ